MAEDTLRKDPAWKYARLQNDQDINTFMCGFCLKVTYVQQPVENVQIT